MVANMRTLGTLSYGFLCRLTPGGLALPLLAALGLTGDASADIVAPSPPGATSPVAPTPSPTVTVTITVTGVRSGLGQVTALLFAGDGGFPAKEARALMRVRTPASLGTVTLTLSGVAPGDYAVTVYHDENDNGKLDTNWIGIPKEPVAVSNNAKGRMGPPKYKDAMFRVGSERKTLQISLIKI